VRTGICLPLLGLFIATAWPAMAAPLTFRDLMEPTMFPDAQFGMAVRDVSAKRDTITVVTTGARVKVDGRAGVITFTQLIGHKREVARLQLPGALTGGKVIAQGSGFALLQYATPSVRIRVNGDSLVMVQPQDAMRLDVLRSIPVAFNPGFWNNHVVCDEWGGFALYCSETQPGDQFNPYSKVTARYDLPAGGVVAVGVCPPKPFDWQKSFDTRVVWHWSDKSAYPTDEQLNAWKGRGNIILLQSEVLLWKDWNLDFVPRLGVAEFERVRQTIHNNGMRFIVYTSPFFFLKDTPQEKNAVNDKPGVCPGAVPDGVNMDSFLPAIRRVMRDLKPDGLYFDGVYSTNPAAQYALARYSRQIVGEQGLLEWHSTAALTDGWGSMCFMPHADVYTDVQLRGEGLNRMYSDFNYLRFFISGYNINNVVGVVCNNADHYPSPELQDNILLANARLHAMVEGKDSMTVYVPDGWYERLNRRLERLVDDGVDAREAKLVASQGATVAAMASLEDPAWQPPRTLQLDFDTFPDGEKVASPADPQPFALDHGQLVISAFAHTYAFLKIPVHEKLQGFEFKVRGDTDGGMHWGPGVGVMWPDGNLARVVRRPDDRIGIGLHGDDPVFPFISSPAEWLWVRCRWNAAGAIVKTSTDGITYRTVWQSQETKHLLGEAAWVYVGKFTSTGEAKDYTEPGAAGKCEFDYVKLFLAK
jgi:hypothetical protein